jgi:hypothetical protein
MLNKIFKSILIGVFALVMTATFTSCEKEKETIAVIIVKNSNGIVVPGASVTLFPESIISPGGVYPDPSLTKTNTTDVNGQARFTTYKLEAILNIEVTKVDGNSTYTGANIIRLLKGKTVTEVVEIN